MKTANFGYKTLVTDENGTIGFVASSCKQVE